MTPAADMTTATVTVVGALIAIVGGMLLIAAFLRRTMKTTAGGRRRLGHPRVIGSCALGVKKSVSLVGVPGAVLVLGVTAEAITLLSRIDDAETIARLENEKSGAPSFADQLRRVVGRGGPPSE